MNSLFSTIRRSAALAVLAIGLGACADSVTAPREEAPRTPDQAIIINMIAPDSTSADFTVTPTGGTFRMGKHAIWFPANAICDPAVSTYGPDTWDQPCTVLSRSIDIHAEVRTIEGKEWVDFTPALRFRPHQSYEKWVWIFMRADGAILANAADFNILYTPAFGAPGIDESLEDPTLRSYVSGGYVYRRIKHFSGYMVASGRSGLVESGSTLDQF